MRTTNTELREMVHFRDERIQALESQVEALLESDRRKDLRITVQQDAIWGQEVAIEDLEAEKSYLTLCVRYYKDRAGYHMGLRASSWCFPVRRFLRWIRQPLP